MKAITLERWQEAQQFERRYWESELRHPDKLERDIAEGHHFTKGILDIRAATVAGSTVLDIAGGPYPIGVGMPLARYAVLDPAPYDDDDPTLDRIQECAEEYRGAASQEVWGYNVLQHVRDPAQVMVVARRCAINTIRWFDVVDTPIYPVHPHSIRADWLRAELSRDGFHIMRDIDGSRLVEGIRQKWVALVAERR